MIAYVLEAFPTSECRLLDIVESALSDGLDRPVESP